MSDDTLPLSAAEPDNLIIPYSTAPSDYPFNTITDEYSVMPFDANYKSRREAFLAFIRRNPAPKNTKSTWHELGRLAAGGVPHLGVLASGLEYMNARKDGSDFILHSILRLVYQYTDHPTIDRAIKNQSNHALLNFKYWPDEPGIDSMCTWTESHYILFSSGGYLAGQLHPEEIFHNSGINGKSMMERHKSRLMRWMNLRFFIGFSEWLSDANYDEDLTALINLVDFCKDEDIRQRATILIDMLLLDIALNNFQGIFGSTHGRSYENSKKRVAEESTIDTIKLLFGRGVFSSVDNMSAIAFSLSDSYQLPRVIYEIANDQERPEMLNRQRMGLFLDQAKWWNLNPKKKEDCLLLLNQEAYFHPTVVNSFIKMMDQNDWWQNPFFEPIRRRKGIIKFLRWVRLLPIVARLYEKDVSRNTREEVNIYTYRTPFYMLSSAQDYKPGVGGDQQHIWQATLGPDAICFTTHPARLHGTPPNYWVGSGDLPRVAQIKNVLFAIYRISKGPGIYSQNDLPYTHAWLPKDCFEEVVENEGWIFARIGNGYLSLLSQHPYSWQELPGENKGREIIVKRRNNIWLCELGSSETHGDFSNFMERILSADVFFTNSRVSYNSPSQGLLTFGWNEPLRRQKEIVQLKNYPRYGNPYAQTQFPNEHFTIQLGEHSLFLDWLKPERDTSTFV